MNNENFLKFNEERQSPLELAKIIKEAINQKNIPIKIAVFNSEFAYNLIMDKRIEVCENKIVGLRKIFEEALKEEGVFSEYRLDAKRRIDERKIGRTFFEPYSTFLVYAPLNP